MPVDSSGKPKLPQQKGGPRRSISPKRPAPGRPSVSPSIKPPPPGQSPRRSLSPKRPAPARPTVKKPPVSQFKPTRPAPKLPPPKLPKANATVFGGSRKSFAPNKSFAPKKTFAPKAPGKIKPKPSVFRGGKKLTINKKTFSKRR